MSHAEAIQRNNDVLLRCTTINLFVIDFLRAKDVLDEEQESDLKAEKSHLKQRILLFQWLKEVSTDRYESFLQVMKDAEQEHVANLLTGSNEVDHLPLSDARHTRLVKIRYKMAYVTQIDSEVIAELRSLRAISMTDAEEIRAETVDYAKVSKLISAIMRRSNYSFNSFQEVLKKTLQTAASEYLEKGEMPAVHINSNRPDLDEPLSLALNGVIRNNNQGDTKAKELLADLNGLSLNPVRAIPGQSIVVFIYCKTVDSAVKFTQVYNSGRLQNILHRILKRLLLTVEPQNTKMLRSLINLEDEEVITLEEFTGIEGWMMESIKGQKRSIAIYRCDASTQTGRQKRRRKPRKRNKGMQKKNDGGSSLLAGEVMRGKSQDMQDKLTSESSIPISAKSQLEKLASWSIVHSSAESLSETASLSLDLSSTTSHIADDDSGVSGWSQGRHIEKKVDELKPGRCATDLPLHAYKSKKEHLQEQSGYPTEVFGLGWSQGRHIEKKVDELKPGRRATDLPLHTYKSKKEHLQEQSGYPTEVFGLEYVHAYDEPTEMQVVSLHQRNPYSLWPNISEEYNSAFVDMDDDNFHPERKLEEVQKENIKLKKQLEQLELRRQRVSLTRKQDDFYLKRNLAETQKQNVKLMIPLEHHTYRDEFAEKYNSDPILVGTIRTKAAEEKNKPIQGLTILDNELFIVSKEISEVEVYDSMRFSFSRRLNLKELIRPEDMGSCNINKCLYIFDAKGPGQLKEILRVHSNGKLIKSWPTGVEYSSGLSVTGESNVILAVHWKNRLNEYSPDGQLIREINLSSHAGIRCPWHAIKLKNGNFVVSYGSIIGDLLGVCIVSEDGKLRSSYHEKRRSITEQMNHPVYLAVDGNGFVMVADMWNHTVLLFDSNLVFRKVILSKWKQGLRDPQRILLDGSNNRLFVAESYGDEEKILIFGFNTEEQKHDSEVALH